MLPMYETVTISPTSNKGMKHSGGVISSVANFDAYDNVEAGASLDETELSTLSESGDPIKNPLLKAIKEDNIDLGETEGEFIDIEGSNKSTFEFSHGLTTAEADRLRLIHGRNELPEKVVPKWYIFVSQLWQPMPMMIWLAALVEAAILNFVDMAILLFIQFANASIGYYEITKAGDAVAALKSQLQAKATVKRDGTADRNHDIIAS
jgi:magnesium-transporting ATPase (P-type)